MNTLTENDSSDTEYVQLKVRVMKINLWTVSFRSCGLFGFAFFILLYPRALWKLR